MDRIPLTRVSTSIRIATALEESGTSPERLLRRLNMPMWHHFDPDQFIPLSHIFTLADLGARTLGTDTFGVRVIECVPFQGMSMIAKVTVGASTVYQALKTFVRLLPRHGSSKPCWLAEGGDEVWLCRGGQILFEAGEREEMNQYALAVMVQIVRLGAGPGWRPSKVKVQAIDTSGLETTEMFSEAQIVPDPDVSAIAIPRSVLSLPIGRSIRPGVSSGKISEERFLALGPSDDFAGSIRQLIATLLPEGYPHIQLAAEITGFSARALQRHLAHEGFTYKRLVEQARFEAATSSLKDTDASVSDIAFDLGYTDVAHFSVAFRRWAGVPPREYRHLSVTNQAVDVAGPGRHRSIDPVQHIPDH